MRRLLIAAALSALVLAKPELYKETEDFQYSRSSSDEGRKSGFYGSQRGNMGGNYEKAHNMDGLAQHQMSGLVRQVDGELGDGYKTRTGSVYTAANSRGIYGSGKYDLSNLQGRNFEETESFGDASLHSSSMSQNVGYRDRSLIKGGAYSNSLAHNSGYRHYQAGRQSADQLKLEDNLQAADRLQSAHGYGYGSQAAQFSNSGFQSHHAYDQSNANSRYSSVYGSNSRNHMLTATPARVVIRPGTIVTVPLTAQTYDANRATSLLENEKINTDAELLTTNGQQSNIAVNAPKHYESSYNYRKKWEKHDTQPIALDAIPTVNSFASQSDLLEGNQAVGLETGQQRSVNSFNSQASNAAYAANTKTAASSQSRYQAGFNTQHSSSSGLSTNGYNAGSHASNDRIATIGTDSANLVELLNSKPKSYHSSYSYHKAWERQGDPYVIQPVGGSQIGQTSQKLTAASLNQGAYSSHHYGSQYNQAHQSFSHNGVDCDDEGHVRLARSYDPNQEQQFDTYQNFGQDQEEFGQQSQSHLEHLEDLGQQVQSKWDNLQDLGQQTQEQLGNLEQLNQHQWDNLQNLGQQKQEKFEKLEDLGQQTETKFDQLEDFGQQSQSQWANAQDLGQHIEEKNNLGQQIQGKWDNLQDLGHQAQEQWGNLEQQSQHQWDNLQNLDQQTQDKIVKLEDLGQQTETKFDQLEDSETQSQSQLANTQDLGQQLEEKKNLGQQMQGKWDNLQDLSHQTQKQWGNLEQQNQHQWDNLQNLGQQIQDNFDKLEDLGQQPNVNQFEDLGQQSQSQWDYLQNSGQRQQSQTTWDNTQQKMQNIWEQQDDHSQQSQSVLEQQLQHGLEKPKEQAFVNFHQQSFHHNQNTINSKETSEQNSFWSQLSKTSSFSNSFESEPNNYQHSFQANTDQEIDTKIPTSLSGLWDKIDSIANKTLSHDTDDNITHTQKSEELPSWIQNQDTNGSHTNLSNNAGAYNKVLTTTESVSSYSGNEQPIDIGRGDIGPEDTHSTSDTSVMSHTYQSYKTPQEIEALSLTQKLNETPSNQYLENQSTNSDWLSILDLDDKQFIEELRKQIKNEEERQTLKSITSTTPKSSNFNNPKVNISNQLDHKTEDTSLNEQQQLEQQFAHFDPQTHELQKSQLEDFGEQMQASWHPEEHFEQTVHNQNVPLTQFSQEPAPVKYFNLKDSSENPENNQSSQKPVKNINMEITYPSTTPLQIDSVTEDPGFWKKVGSKLSNAKSKVYSWFQST